MSVKKVLCIEIGSNTIRVAEVSGNTSGFRIHAAAMFSVPSGVVRDGSILDVEKLSACIVQKLEEKGIRSKKAVFSIVSNKIMNREVSIPYVRKQQIDSVIRLHADEYFPMGLNRQAVSYIITSENKAADRIDAMVYAAPEELIRGYYNLATAMGVEVRSLDYYGNAIFQWMKEALEDRAVMLIRIGYDFSQATIMTNSTLRMQRSINYGVNDIIDAAIESGFNNDRAKALELLGKKKFIAERLDDENELEDKQIGDITDSVRNMIGNLTRFIDYFYSKRKDSFDSIEHIMVLDVGNDIKGLSKLISNELGIKLIKLNEIDELVDYKKFGDADSRKFFAAIGATINPVGFVTASILEEKIKRAERNYFSTAFKILGSLSAALIIITGVKYGILISEHKKLSSEIERLSYIESIADEKAAAQENYAKTERIHSLTYCSNEKLSQLFSDLEKNLPGTTVVNSMSSSENILTLSISVDSNETAAEAIMQLRSLNYLKNVAVSSVTDTADPVTGAEKVSFTITALFVSDTSLEAPAVSEAVTPGVTEENEDER